MANLSKEAGQGAPNERWDPRNRTLTVEGRRVLGADVRDVSVALTTGRIRVRGTDQPQGIFTSRLIVSADTEQAARNALRDKRGDLEVREEPGRLIVDGTAEEGIGGGSVNIVSGRGGIAAGVIMGDVVIGDGISMVSSYGRGSRDGIWVNGVRIDPNAPGTRSIAGMTREVDVDLPRDPHSRYRLSQTAGETIVEGVVGTGRVSSVAGEVSVSHARGELDISTRSGDVNIYDFRGRIGSQSGGGDFRAEGLLGTADVNTTGGDIEVSGEFQGSSRLKSVGGDIKLVAENDSLSVEANTVGGDISTSREVTVDRRTGFDRPRGGSIVIQSGGFSSIQIGSIGGGGHRSLEGHIGDYNPDLQDRVRIDTTGGDIRIKKAK